MDYKHLLNTLLDRVSLDQQTTEQLFLHLMQGELTSAQIAALLIAFRMKGETVEEIAGAAQAMRSLSAKVTINPGQASVQQGLIDTCGTGGDGASTFNISTAVAFVVAAAGGHVAKHGNRSMSSKSGSADLLEAAGVKLEIPPEAIARSVETIGIGFMFAPKFHAAMKHAVGPRRELGVRTIFNLLGPLTNPAGAPNQLIGLFDVARVEPIAQVLQRLGCQRAMVVAAEDGLDEISIASQTQVAELMAGQVQRYTIDPKQFGFTYSDLTALKVDSPEESLAMIEAVFDDQPGPALDIVLLNAGAAIYTAGLAKDLSNGIEMARDAISSGLAKEKLKELVSFTECATF